MGQGRLHESITRFHLISMIFLEKSWMNIYIFFLSFFFFFLCVGALKVGFELSEPMMPRHGMDTARTCHGSDRDMDFTH